MHNDSATLGSCSELRWAEAGAGDEEDGDTAYTARIIYTLCSSSHFVCARTHVHELSVHEAISAERL